jgi:hypothetical protein
MRVLPDIRMGWWCLNLIVTKDAEYKRRVYNIRMAKPKRPRDPNQLAKLITDLSTGDFSDIDPDAGKNPAAIARGKAGGAKGGTARASALTPERRKEIAKKAAGKRWAR